MGRTQKKNSKGRLDRYYYLAKEKGYRARSSFKLIQVNEKYGHFLEKSKVVVDLCAAPGSWCQVACNLCPINSLIVGVDIVPMKPLPNCITFQSDITTEDCRSKLRGHLKTWKADTFLHDGAPNVGLGWVQDAFTQSQLVLKALRLAVEHLVQGGTFVTKVFRSRDYNNLIWVFQQLFDKVEATKPPASRNVSAEIFVVCKGFKAPKKLDPRLLDSKEVFEEVAGSKQNHEAQVFNPEKHTRQREGYEEGNYLLYKEMDLLEFIKDDEPINRLGDLNKLVEPEKTNEDWRILKKLRLWTPELLECIKDLKVLGKKEFKHILRFRKQARQALGMDEVSEEKIETEKLTEEEKINKELADLAEKQRLKRRREKKTSNEAKQKELRRLQMNMLTDMSIGIEAAESGSLSLFNLVSAKKTGKIDALTRGRKQIVFDSNDENETGISKSLNADENELSTDYALNLESQLDEMYADYKQRRAEKDAKYRVKLARGDLDAEKWEGFQENTANADLDSADEEEGFDSDWDLDEDVPEQASNQTKSQNLSKDAQTFFARNEIFDELDESLLSESLKENNVSRSLGDLHSSAQEKDSDPISSYANKEDLGEGDGSTHDGFDNDSSDEEPSHETGEHLDSAQAMTLAHKLALGQINKHDLVNEGMNRYSFRDRDNLPDWFIEDEKQHSKITKPITKEAAAAIREREKQMNARPIKKVLEAQGRKKMRALKRLEKLKKKSDLINEDSAKSEKDKADEIQSLMRKLSNKQKKRPKPSLVVAKGANKGLSGRPRGVKGKYKMVDGVMKNEQRALKRIAKKHKK